METIWCILLMYLFIANFRKCVSIDFITSDKLNVSLQIRTSDGLIQGRERTTILGKKYYNFQGIPYARPPLNELRFTEPKPMRKWFGVLNATVIGPCCAGLNFGGLTNFEFTETGQEDCLYLNVYTPQKPREKSNKSLAVMVFFYGGGFIVGCSDEYGPDFFMEHDVVLVIPNYRISIFGFLSTEDSECPGNWAAKDLIASLKWVQLNIHRFGGDPKKVTIFGQSAGANMVNTLLMSHKSKSLFHKAIIMSGSSLSFWGYQTQPRKIAFDVGIALGIETNSSKSLLDQLRKMDSSTITKGHLPAIIINFLTVLTNGLPVTPSIEPKHKDAVISSYPYDILEKGQFNRVPVMMGVTTMEFAFFRKLFSFIKPLLVLFNASPGMIIRITNNFKNKRIVAEKIIRKFLKTDDFTLATEEDFLIFQSEDSYFRPIRKTASLISRYSPVYFYQFAYEGPRGLKLLKEVTGSLGGDVRDFKGVAHSEDLAYLFTSDRYKVGFNKDDIEYGRKLSKIYTNFAKTGNPTPVQDPYLDNVTWPRITPEKCPYMRLDKTFSVMSNFNEDNYQFWEDIYKQYADKPYKAY